jgi:hypothetical protein
VTALIVILGVAVVVLLVVTLGLARRGRAAGGDPGGRAPAPAVPALVGNVAVVTLYELWMRRVEQEKLGGQSDAGADLGDLLAEVLYAAGGVERELRELRQSQDDARRLAGREPPPPTVLLQVQPTSAPQERPTAHALVAARPQREASYCFVNLLSWARLTVERTDRPYKPGSSGRAGLLPALRPGELRDKVEAALQHLRTALKDSRSLSSYAFHAGAVPGKEMPGLGGEALELTEDRDMLAYATELMAATEAFVDRVLDAFATRR